MRRFSSYGPINDQAHYYAPRKELIETGYTQLVGENPAEGGHYFTVWAPRQCGKTWIIQEVVKKIRQTGLYEVAICSVGRAKEVTDEEEMMKILIEELQDAFDLNLPHLKKISDLPGLFTKKYFKKPVILALDEFDALEEEFISRYANIFRELYIGRTNKPGKPGGERIHLLHGLALIGVRSVLGIENDKGSPFNVQRSLKIPNLSLDEVKQIFQWYEKESGQEIQPEVIERLFREVNGQPGLTCWFGELLTETYNKQTGKPITLENFEEVYATALNVLPNNNILNIISKAKKEPYKYTILDLFKTDEKMAFKYDDTSTNYLYMHGVIDQDIETPGKSYIKFACPFIQERLFNYFSNELFHYVGKLHEPADNLGAIVTETALDIKNLAKLYREYLKKNMGWLFEKVPRRSDGRIFEAVYHFNFYAYLEKFLMSFGGWVIPEFPTGNGKIDLLVTFRENKYGIELKSFTNEWSYKQSLDRAARYGKQLGLDEIFLVFFVEYLGEELKTKYEQDYLEKETGVIVKPIIMETSL